MPREATGNRGNEEVRQLRGRTISSETKATDQHICETCDKRFASAASLESHKRIHTMKQGPGEGAPAKRRAVAPASAPEPKKARVQQEQSHQESGLSTRSGGEYKRLIRCKVCEETFEEKDEWVDHMRERHPPKTTASSQESTPESPSRVTRRSALGASSTVPASDMSRKQPSTPFRSPDMEVLSPARSSPRISPSPSLSAQSRSRNTTLRFEEELINGNVQCRQCHQVFNNRRGLAAHVAQKHREELDMEQRTIEEEKSRKDDTQRRRRDASRLLYGGIPQIITPSSRPISILSRRSFPSVLQKAGGTAFARASAVIATPGSGQSLSYPRKTTLEILTQPTPLVQHPKPSTPSRSTTTPRDKPASQAGKDDQSRGAYAEPLDEPSTSHPAVREKGTTDRPRSTDSNEDEGIDESAYEFSTEVTVAAVPSQGGEGSKSSNLSSPQRPLRSRSMAAGRRQTYMYNSGEDADVDHYPCKFCKDRTFLTPYGLERHTKMSHPVHLEEVLIDIQKAQMEKAKRSEGAGFSGGLYIDEDGREGYDRFQHMDGRHHIPGLGQAAQSANFLRRKFGGYLEKENEPSDDPGEILQMAREQSAALVACASFTDNRIGIRTRRQNDVPRAKYQSCDICGILINTEHPKALESHTKAHQKNQELRQELLRLYGTAWVERVTCRECNLVFKDEDKLDQHRRNVHVRRRHFLCRFCGDVFRNMRDLNAHKERRHGSVEGHRRVTDNSSPAQRRAGSFQRGYDSVSSDVGNGGSEEFACRTTCDVCGVLMARPSNLIRHMKLAHNRTNFTATVETRGMPPFKLDVNDGQFMWGCCDEVFDDRHTFINHRRAAHGLTQGGTPKECEHCGLKFRNTAAYIQHLRTHRPRVCNICGESFGNSVVDLNAFRAHMIRHRGQGYTVRLPPIEEELSTREQQELWRAINDEEADDGSEDEYSVFSESGVESDLEDDSASDIEDVPEDQMTCAMCEKVFSCAYGYKEHWKLHCRQSFRSGVSLKTKPFSYKQRRLAASFKCGGCRKKFLHAKNWAVHTLVCLRRRRGVLPAEETSITSSESSKPNSPTKSTPTKSPRRELRPRTPKSGPASSIEDPKDTATVSKGNELEESMKELEDQLEKRPNEKKFVPDYIEKAYVVEWNTNKTQADKPYTCQNCGQAFGDFLGLVVHIRTHITHPIVEDEDVENENEKGKQDGAKDEKMTASVLRIRTSTSEALGKYSCQVCGRYFQDKKLLQTHLDEVHRPKKRHRCTACGRRFWSTSALRRHDRRRHNAFPQIHYCGTCGKKFVSAESLTAHETKHELQNSLYQCEDCSVSFYGLQQLKAHFKEHHQGVTILPCPICSRIHTDRKALNEHIETDHASVRTLCKICGKSFHTPAEARQHRHRVHLQEGKSFESCTLCGKKFFDKRALSVHLWRHLSTKNYQCLICDKPFENAESVRTHLEKVHSVGWLDSRDLIVQNSTVFDGERAADEERRFSCYVCGKKDNSKAAVNKHLRDGVHNRVKTKECTHCGIKFTKQYSLADHLNRRHQQRMSGKEQDKVQAEQGVNVAETISEELAQLLMNQGQLQYLTGESVQMIVADDATAAAVMGASGGNQEYQVLLVQNENGETIQLALGPQAQVEMAQLQDPQPTIDTANGNVAGAGGQPMEIDETNYQQFLNQ